MSRALAALVLLVAVSCSGSVGQSDASPHVSPSAGSSSFGPAFPSSPGPSTVASGARTPISFAPLGRVGLSCRLPVVIAGQPLYGLTGGFITFPAGTYAPDPGGVINPIGDGELATQATPTLQGYALTWPFYDLAAKRWIPVGAGQSSPDGLTYAFVAPPLGSSYSLLFVYTVATGANHFVELPDPAQGTGQFFNIGDYDGRYAYVVAEQVDGFPKGVWRVNPATGASTPLLAISAGNVLLVQNGVAWIGLVNPTDPSPPHPPKGQAFDTIESINLSTGATTTWIYGPGHSVIFWGLDSSSHPVVMVTSPPSFDAVTALTLIDAPGSNGIAIPAGFLPLGDMEADAGRLWFGGPDGVYYWTQATGLIKVDSFRANPAVGDDQSVFPAGHCA